MDDEVKIGQVYVHYKTKGVYVVWALAKVEKTLEDVVVYMGQDGRFWTRPLAEFTEYVAVGDTEVRRFVRVTSANMDALT